MRLVFIDAIWTRDAGPCGLFLPQDRRADHTMDHIQIVPEQIIRHRLAPTFDTHAGLKSPPWTEYVVLEADMMNALVACRELREARDRRRDQYQDYGLGH